MKKKKTLSTQLTFVISFIVLLIVGVFWMANNTLLEKYYVFNKEKEMLAVYKMVDFDFAWHVSLQWWTWLQKMINFQMIRLL